MNKTSIEWTDYTSNLIRYRDPEGVEDLVVRLEPAAARYLSVWELTFEERVAVIGGGNIVLSVIGAQPPVGMYVLEVGDGGE